MRVLLVNPPIPLRDRIREFAPGRGNNVLTRDRCGSPCVLDELAGALQDHDVRIVDLKYELDEAPASEWADRLDQELATFGPDVVGIPCITPQRSTPEDSRDPLLDFVRSYTFSDVPTGLF